MFYVLLIAYCFNVPIIQLRNQSIILQKFNYYKNQFPRGERERERERERKTIVEKTVLVHSKKMCNIEMDSSRVDVSC